MRLAHIHIPHLISYTHASYLQELLVQRHFRYKDLLRASKPNHITQQDPTILTFSTPPTYTVGRRYLASATNPAAEQDGKYTISPTQIAYLTGTSHSPPSSQSQFQTTPSSQLASFYPSPRGGDLTYHAPGQLVAYPIIDLRAHSITPRNYIRLLESCIIQTCTVLGVADTHTTEDPGVWLSKTSTAPIRKICALGVQVRRGITGHGLGFNVLDMPAPEVYVNDDGSSTKGYLSWGFGRIVACGLEGKGVTWLSREGARDGLGVEDVAGAFVREFAKGLGLAEDIYEATEGEIVEQEGKEGEQGIVQR